MIPYTPPEFKRAAFNCPNCNAFANQVWQAIAFYPPGGGVRSFEDLWRAECAHCHKYTLWQFEKMIYPEDSGVRPPNSDLRDDIKEDYLEAKGIVNKSPNESLPQSDKEAIQKRDKGRATSTNSG